MTLILARKPFSRGTAPTTTLDKLAAYVDRMLGNIEQAIPPQTVLLVDADYIATVEDQTIVVDATAAPVTISFQAPARVAYGTWTVKKIDASAHAVTIGATVDGVASPTLATQWKSITIQSDGTQFLKLAAV